MVHLRFENITDICLPVVDVDSRLKVEQGDAGESPASLENEVVYFDTTF